MTNVYSVKIDKNSPFRVQFINETNDEIDTYTINKFDFNNLCQNNYYTDTNHDNTTNESGIPSEDKAINLAYSFYPDRFNELKFMLVKKTEYRRINNGDYTVEVTHVDTKNSSETAMSFIDFVKNVLKIDFDETQIPHTPGNKILLETCQNPPKDTPVRNFYTFLNLYDIRDMNRGFISGRNSVSFHVDSATSPDTLRLVPNICTQFYNGKFNIFGFQLPGTGDPANPAPGFRNVENTNFSFLYFGDLMIAHYYFNELQLGGIVNGFEDFTHLYPHFFSNDPANPATLNTNYTAGINGATPADKNLFVGLCRFSLIALNIFWQTLLSYMHIYMKLQIGDDSNDVIQALRQWVFCGINYNDTKPSFNGKFIKTIVYDPTNVSYVAYWFLHAHHSRLPLPIGPGSGPFVCHLMKQDSSVQEFAVTQGDCANYINEICDYCNADPIAIPRPGPFKKINLYRAINEAFPYTSKNINDPLIKLIIKILQILKYSGDMSHKVAVMIYKIVFSIIAAFKNFTPAVTTTDRPLIKDLFIDNIPGIITSANATILQLSSITNLFGHTINSLIDTGQVLFAFYLPVLQTDIFSLILKYINKLNNYIILLNKLYDPALLCFQEQIFRDKRELETKIIVNVIYKYLTYITMFYLSLFSSEIVIPGAAAGAGGVDDLVENLAAGAAAIPGAAGAAAAIPGAVPAGAAAAVPGAAVPAGAAAGAVPNPFVAYEGQYVNGNRVNYAWFAYLYFKNPFNKIKMDKLFNTKFVGVDEIVAAHTVIQTFLKNQTQLFVSNATHAPDCVRTLNDVLSAHSYPVCFEIKSEFYTAAAAGAADAKEQSLKDYVSSLFSLYKNLVKHRDDLPLNYGVEIETEFFEKMSLRTELGGILPQGTDPVLPNSLNPTMDVDAFYKQYLFFDSGHSFDESLLKLSNLYNTYSIITDVVQSEKYEDLFKPKEALSSNQLIPDAGKEAMFDSNFLYTYQYKTRNNEFTPLNNPLTPAGFKKCWVLFYNIQNVDGIIEDSFFDIRQMVLTKVVNGPTFSYDPGFYLFPFLRLHRDFIQGGIYKKVYRPFAIDKKFLNYTLEQNEAALLIDLFNNLLKYVSDLNDFLDLYEQKIAFYQFAPNNLVKEIFQGVQCRFIIFFSLLMFNFSCNYPQILQIHYLFRSKPLYFLDEPLFSTNVDDAVAAVSANEYEHIRLTNPKKYKRAGSKVSKDPDIFFKPSAILTDIIDPAIPANVAIVAELTAAPAPSINCIGLFTTDPLYSNTLAEFDFTKIKGLYFIANKRLKLVYDELQNKLSDFFMKYDMHFGDGFYGDIKFL